MNTIAPIREHRVPPKGLPGVSAALSHATLGGGRPSPAPPLRGQEGMRHRDTQVAVGPRLLQGQLLGAGGLTATPQRGPPAHLRPNTELNKHRWALVLQHASQAPHGDDSLMTGGASGSKRHRGESVPEKVSLTTGKAQGRASETHPRDPQLPVSMCH